MMNMTEFVAAGGANCAAAYWRYQQRQQRTLQESIAIDSLDMTTEEMITAMQEENQQELADMDARAILARDAFESGWDI